MLVNERLRNSGTSGTKGKTHVCVCACVCVMWRHLVTLNYWKACMKMGGFSQKATR